MQVGRGERASLSVAFFIYKNAMHPHIARLNYSFSFPELSSLKAMLLPIAEDADVLSVADGVCRWSGKCRHTKEV
jgi:hypothetical protein